MIMTILTFFVGVSAAFFLWLIQADFIEGFPSHTYGYPNIISASVILSKFTTLSYLLIVNHNRNIRFGLLKQMVFYLFYFFLSIFSVLCTCIVITEKMNGIDLSTFQEFSIQYSHIVIGFSIAVGIVLELAILISGFAVSSSLLPNLIIAFESDAGMINVKKKLSGIK